MIIDPVLGSMWEVLESNTLSHMRKQQGEVAFATSQLTDDYIRTAIQLIADHTQQPVQAVTDDIVAEVNKHADRAKITPMLGSTSAQNAAESATFTAMWKTGTSVPGSLQFKEPMFFRLHRIIAGERSEFFPLVSWIDRRRLSANPSIEFTDTPHDDESANTISTAAATPSGRFYYNTKFMQCLMDWAHLKGVKGNSDKYVSQGGPIPDEYCYIEFVIMHECMHYTNDDFYYQHIIPDADSNVINLVGDFRTNYFLVKNGFAQLPIGLFSDHINLDRQSTYRQMYDAVKDELNKLPKQDQAEVGKGSDNHAKGQSEGRSSQNKNKTSGSTEADIDKHQKQAQESAEQVNDPTKPPAPSKDSHKSTQPGSGKGESAVVAYKHIRPTYDWKSIIRRMITSAKPMIDTNWSKVARRSITGLHVARSRGAGAIQPAEVPLDTVQVNIALVLDTSGSMQRAVPIVFANVANMMKQPQFKRNNIALIQFSDGHEAFVINVAANKSGPMNEENVGKHQAWTGTVDDVLSKATSGGTNITSAIPTIEKLLARGFNVLICSDTDLTHEPNRSLMVKLLVKYTKQVFWILPDAQTYEAWVRSNAFVSTNVTHL